jgi:hypothetical protein
MAGSRRLLLATAVVVVAALAAVALLVSDRRTKDVRLEHQPGEVDRTTQATEESLETYWRDQMNAVYQRDLIELRGGFQPKTASSPAFSCAGRQQTYRDILARG